MRRMHIARVARSCEQAEANVEAAAVFPSGPLGRRLATVSSDPAELGLSGSVTWGAGMRMWPLLKLRGSQPVTRQASFSAQSLCSAR